MRATPIFPDSFYAPAVKGSCRWCARTCLPSRTWHKECLAEYMIVTRPGHARAAVWKRDHGRCARCGSVTRHWEADHRRPLWQSNGRLWYFTLANIQTLCKNCHRLKTAYDTEQYRASLL